LDLLAKTEEIISVEQKKRVARDESWYEAMRPFARTHATAVAAILMFGDPQIDEPLIRAWRRAFKSLGITPLNEYGREYSYKHVHDPNDIKEFFDNFEYVGGCKELYPIIIKDANESQKFAEIFRDAPIWLLEFTNMRSDGLLLHFSVPPSSNKFLNEAMRKRWPNIPFGTVTDLDLGLEIVSGVV
jgi:hypothetical protein